MMLVGLFLFCLAIANCIGEIGQGDCVNPEKFKSNDVVHYDDDAYEPKHKHKHSKTKFKSDESNPYFYDDDDLIAYHYNADWMQYIDDETWISRISIPGTHNSAALFENWSGDLAKCQSRNLTQQLLAGIRFLDIRLRRMDDVFTIHHGPVYQKQNFGDVLRKCKQFLQEHPTETILMRYKQEYSEASNAEIYETFNATKYKRFHYLMHFGNESVPLKDVRGKIVLLPDIKTLPGIPFNRGSFRGCDRWDFRIYMYRYEDTDAWREIKFNDTKHSMILATRYYNNPSNYEKFWYTGLNTISTFCVPSCWAENTNEKVYNYFRNEANYETQGIVAMDFMGIGLISEIIKRNAFNWNFSAEYNETIKQVHIWNVGKQEYLYASQMDGFLRREIYTWKEAKNRSAGASGWWSEMRSKTLTVPTFLFQSISYREFLYASTAERAGVSGQTRVYTWRIPSNIDPSMMWEKKRVGEDNGDATTYMLWNAEEAGKLCAFGEMSANRRFVFLQKGASDDTDQNCLWIIS